MMLVSSDILVLINYTSFAEAGVIGIAVAGLLFLRWKRPDMPRSIKATSNHFLTHLWTIKYRYYIFLVLSYRFQLPLFIPIIFFMMCVFLVVFPFLISPMEVVFSLLIVLSGVPVYLVFVHWQKWRPLRFDRIWRKSLLTII